MAISVLVFGLRAAILIVGGRDDMQQRRPVGHSARVRMNLHVAGHVVPLSHIGPDFCRSARAD